MKHEGGRRVQNGLGHDGLGLDMVSMEDNREQRGRGHLSYQG